MGIKRLWRIANERSQYQGQSPRDGVGRGHMAQKPSNGQGQGGSYLLTFDLEDPGQLTAWQKAQELASQRKLKHVLTGMLLAIHTVEQHTGKPIDLTDFMAKFVTNLVTGGGYKVPTLELPANPDALPNMFSGTENRADPAEARQSFAGGMGNLFLDDEEEWD